MPCSLSQLLHVPAKGERSRECAGKLGLRSVKLLTERWRVGLRSDSCLVLESVRVARGDRPKLGTRLKLAAASRATAPCRAH